MNKKLLDTLKQRAAQEDPSTNKLFTRLKKHKKQINLDETFHTLHEEVFGEIDCLECANCCKSISPIIHEKDIQRIARHLKIRSATFTEKYLTLDEDGDYVFQSTPCPFLLPDNYCMIYEIRPRSCREYPHTDHRNMFKLLNLTLKNTYVCPAVFEIVKRIKNEPPL